MTTANKITIFRFILVPVLVVLMYLKLHYWALAVFILASLSDFADGYIARHYDQVSDFGKFMDPLADKVLVLSAMTMFVEWHVMPAWVLIIVLVREFAVSGLRLVAVDNGRVIAAAWSGKIKTTVTMVGIILMMAFGIPQEITWLNTTVWILIAVTTLYSGAEYFIKNKDVLSFK
ncbi:MAG: CDP-diacylglycerol--glycerol-3-phosphate 3-phosphatidyltransferase [Oscillospiraceae bacterium]|nr:CDP-diacylglycerol--glycerol-3-phosphate 3-phosphatidyltransferase [Oscillospiraceae bacterium]